MFMDNKAKPIAVLVREIGETNWFDHLPVKLDAPNLPGIKSSPELDYVEVYDRDALYAEATARLRTAWQNSTQTNVDRMDFAELLEEITERVQENCRYDPAKLLPPQGHVVIICYDGIWPGVSNCGGIIDRYVWDGKWFNIPDGITVKWWMYDPEHPYPIQDKN